MWYGSPKYYFAAGLWASQNIILGCDVVKEFPKYYFGFFLCSQNIILGFFYVPKILFWGFMSPFMPYKVSLGFAIHGILVQVGPSDTKENDTQPSNPFDCGYCVVVHVAPHQDHLSSHLWKFSKGFVSLNIQPLGRWQPMVKQRQSIHRLLELECQNWHIDDLFQLCLMGYSLKGRRFSFLTFNFAIISC